MSTVENAKNKKVMKANQKRKRDKKRGVDAVDPTELNKADADGEVNDSSDEQLRESTQISEKNGKKVKS